MGQCATAYLAFGFLLSDEDEEKLNDSEFDIDDAIRKLIPQPAPDDLGGHSGPEWDKWREDLRVARKIFPVEFVYQGYDGEERFVAIRKSIFSADWGDPTYLDHLPNTPDEEDVETLRLFCVQQGITFEKPRWALVAHYS